MIANEIRVLKITKLINYLKKKLKFINSLKSWKNIRQFRKIDKYSIGFLLLCVLFLLVKVVDIAPEIADENLHYFKI